MNKDLDFELLEKIKQKKELAGLADEIILDSLKNYFKKIKKSQSQQAEGYFLSLKLGNNCHTKVRDITPSLSNKIFKKKLAEKDKKAIISEIRAELRRYTGRFQNLSEGREKLVLEGKEKEILNTHASTKERIDFYPEIIKILNGLKTKSILDLGCGINPLALARKGIDYYALDIKKDELDLIKEFFVKEGISGETLVFDLRKIRDTELPAVDVCLILKVFDVLEKQGHKLAEEIIDHVKCRYFIISFSTKTLSGKPMNHPQRGWIERLLERKGLKFRQIKSKNEIFYLAEKSPII